MTAPAYAHVQQQESLEQRAARVVASIQAREAEHDLALSPHLDTLYRLFLDWRATDPRKATTRQGLAFDGYLSAFAAFTGLNVGSLYEWLDAGQASYSAYWFASFPLGHAAAQVASTKDRAVIGKALRKDWTVQRIESALSEGGLSALRAALSESEGEADASDIEAARTRAAALNPDLPKQKRAQDTLNAQAINLLPAPIMQAAYAAARGEQAAVNVLSAVQEAAKPVSYYSWLKMRGRCWTCGLLPGEGEIMDLHHLPIGDTEARPNDDSPVVMAAAHRACHIAQPFSTTPVAHSRAHGVGSDAERLVRVIHYNASHLSAYQKAIGADA